MKTMEDYVKAYDAMCKRAGCRTLEMYDDEMIAVFENPDGCRNEWTFLRTSPSMAFVDIIHSKRLNEWRNGFKYVHDNHVTCPEVKKFIAEVVLEHAQKGEIYFFRDKKKVIVARRNETLESLLVEYDMKTA